MIVLSVLFLILGAAVLVTGLMGLTGTLPGNRWVGLHIPEVRKSKAMWDTGHRIVGPFWTGAGAAILVGGLVSFAGGWMWAVAAILLIGGLGLIGVGAANAAHIMAQIDLRKGQEAEQKRAAAGCCSSGGGDAASDTAGTADTAGAAGTAATTTASGLVIPAVGDSCGGSCDDCGACDHDETGAPVNSSAASPATPAAPSVAPDLDAARRAMAAQDSHSAK